MTPETISALVNWGPAGAVIIVVVIFLKYIEKRDRDWQTFFQQVLDNKDTPLQKLIEVVQTMISEFQAHDAWEHGKLDELSAKVNPRQRTRKDP